MDYYYSVSYDEIEWSDWKEFKSGATDIFDEYNLESLYFKYKVVIRAESTMHRPYLQSIQFILQPYSNIINSGDLVTRPKIWLRKKNGDGDITLVNQMTGQSMELKDIQNNEEIFIDCEYKEIISSLQYLGIYRFDSHNDEYLELIRGDNYLKGYGDFDFDIRHYGYLLQDN